MIAFHSLLAAPAWLGENMTWIVIAALAVVAVIGFIVGAVKGFTRLGWGAFIWGVVCTVFYVLETKLHDDNPVLKLEAVKKLDAGVQSFISTLTIALVCILGALIVFGILGLIFHRKSRRVGLRYSRYSDNYDDDDDDDDYYGDSPCVVNRIFGGLVGAINSVLVVAAILCLALVIIDLTPLSTNALEVIYVNKFMDKTWTYIHAHTLDFIFLAIIAAISYGGYRMGAIRGLRSVIMTFGFIAAIVVGFWLPFSKYAADGAALEFLGKVSGFFTDKMGSLSAKISDALGKVICGAIVAVVFCIAVGIAGLLLKLLTLALKHVPALRFVDGILATVIMMVIGVAVCAVIAGVLYILEHYGVFEASALFDSSSSFTQGLYDTFDEYLKPLLERIGSALN